jgi:hypothetical protein
MFADRKIHEHRPFEGMSDDQILALIEQTERELIDVTPGTQVIEHKPRSLDELLE